MIDYFIALLPALFLGSTSVVLVAQGGDDRQRTIGLLTGAFLFSALATPFIEVHWTPRTLIISFISGVILGIGQYLQVICLKVLGVSRTMPLTTAGQIIFMCLGGIVLFGEMNHGLALVFALSAIALFLSPRPKRLRRPRRKRSIGGVEQSFWLSQPPALSPTC